MGNMTEERTGGMIASVLIALGLGVLMAFTLPVASSDDSGFDDDEVPTYFEFARIVTAFGEDRWWLADLAKAGVVVAAVAAIAFPRSERRAQALVISAGALATLGMPIWIYTELDGGESLGSGIIVASIAFVVAAVIPWVALAMDPDDPPVVSPPPVWSERPPDRSIGV